MTNKEIIEGNILIADFMGLEKSTTTIYPDTQFYKSHNLSTEGYPKKVDGYIISNELQEINNDDEGDIFLFLEALRYHLCWDWLMIVCDKIECIPESKVIIYKKHCYISKDDNEFHFGVDYHSDTRILATWFAIIEFIKYYNK